MSLPLGRGRWRRFGPIRYGRPRGVARIIAVLVALLFLEVDSRTHQLRLPLPWGITAGQVIAAAVLLFVVYTGFQLANGEATSSIDSPTTLDLDGPPGRGGANRR